MKKKLITCLSISALIAGGLSAALFMGDKKSKEVEGYSTSSLPTTIDLNDASDTQIRSYYSSLNNLATSERQGTNLLKNLKPILKNNQKYYAYDGTNEGKKIWKMYEIIDRDWDKSPASEISGYNSSTNKITGYRYGSSYSDPGTNPFLHSLYVDREAENLMRAWKKDNDTMERVNHGNNAEWYIDREHIWPKAEGFETESSGGARGDPMHLWSADSQVNSDTHSNYYFGYVDFTKEYESGSWSYGTKNHNGTSLTLGGSKTVFEPQDDDKGDIARAVFYMVARYNYLSGSDSDGIDSNNPNLALTQSLNDWESKGYESSTTKTGKMGILTDLLAWHHSDPVDEFEIHRNNLLYTNYTNNRNPFIDFPEWVDFIWGTASYNGRNYQSYSTTPTGYAKPNTDTINGYNSGGDPVAVTGVSVSPSQSTISVGEKVNLTADVTPGNATNRGVAWTSSNPGVALVSDSGVVTGLTAGNTTITATTFDGGFTASCSVKVNEKEPEPVDITIDKDDYTSGYSTSGTSGTISKTVSSTNDLSISYSGINTESSGGSAYSYTMYVGGNGYIYNTSCPSGYYPSNLVVSFTSQTSDSGKVGINFGSSVISTKQTVSGSVPKGGSISLVNNDSTKKYWNFSTSSANVQVTSIVVTYTPIVEPITSISATVNDDKTFYVGDLITKSDITVTTNTNIDVTSLASFSDYQFTYSDATSGGALTNKVLTNAVTYGDFACSLTAKVQRMAYEANEDVSDELTLSFTGVTSTSAYKSWSNKEAPTSDAVYAGNNCGGNSAIQLRSSTTSGSSEHAGIVSTSSGGNIHTVSVSWNSNCAAGRTLNVYGKNTAYTNQNDLYNDSNKGALLGTIKKGTNTSITVSGYYAYVGICSDSGAIYLDDITFNYYGQESPSNISNYIMFEDTNNQCTSKTNVAIGYYNNLSTDGKTTFLTSNDYVISSARERFMAWLSHEGKIIGEDNNIKGTKVINLINDANPSSIIIIILSACGVMSLGGYFLFKRKKGR